MVLLNERQINQAKRHRKMDACLNNKRSDVYYKIIFLLYFVSEICGVWGTSLLDQGPVHPRYAIDLSFNPLKHSGNYTYHLL
jgi:hypothetical protein